jgi:glycerophosphoryl diester phosphodiesterase
MRDLKWLVEKPIAHRGLQAVSKGIVENCESAFAAAIKYGYAIECDIELTKDGEAVVFHDDEIDRLMEGSGKVKTLTTTELKQKQYRQGKDKIQTLDELLEQVDGRSTLVTMG